jgi:hypothetical protein
VEARHSQRRESPTGERASERANVKRTPLSGVSLAEAKGFEPLVPYDTAVFKISSDGNPCNVVPLSQRNHATRPEPGGTEFHQLPPGDQAGDQKLETHNDGGDQARLLLIAQRFLHAVAAGSSESFELVRDLVDASLGLQIFSRTLDLKSRLDVQDPFVLIRGVELAELIAQGAIQADCPPLGGARLRRR